MRRSNILLLPIICLAVCLLSSCAVIGGIFKAGMAVGVIVILVVVFLLIWIISLFRGRS